MKSTKLTAKHPKGFTLVEIVITVLAVGILGAIFIQFMGTALEDSWQTVEIVHNEAEREGVMEQIIADYVRLLNTDPDTALATMVSTYHNQSINGNAVTVEYKWFDDAGNEIDPTPTLSFAVKVTIQGSGNNLVTILTESRDAGDPFVRY